MPDVSPAICSLIGLGVLSLLLAAGPLSGGRLRTPTSLRTPWALLGVLCAAEWLGFWVAIWLLALFSFAALREYFSLVDIRLQDRWGILAAFLSIPFMIVLIQIDWYGFFIVSIPVYAFLIVPFLVVLGGGDPKGSVLSIGAIDLGLFLFVYCLGHIGYLVRADTGLALLLVLSVAACDLADRLWQPRAGPLRTILLKYLVAAPATLSLALLCSFWSDLPTQPAVVVGLLLPALVFMGNFTLGAIEIDLGIDPGRLEPGRGRLLDATRCYLFSAPVVFHFLRYATEIL